MHAMPFILGLTGSIGMGKTTAANHFRQAGVPVFDADLAVARLYHGEAVPLIEEAFPGTVWDGAVDRDLLAKRVLTEHPAIRHLEALVHPLVRSAETRFLQELGAAGIGLAVLDIPLLFETQGETRCDAVVVVSASLAAQRGTRPGPGRHERGAVRGHPATPDARCGKATPGTFRDRHIAQPRGRRAGRWAPSFEPSPDDRPVNSP